VSADRIDYEEWHNIIRSMETIVSHYDRMNDLTTFFQVERWRKAAAAFSGEELDILEIGCGPGSFAKHLSGRRIICVDPSEALLGVAKIRLNQEANFMQGEAESLPFESDSFDRIFCSFSFRDFRDKKQSLIEIHRALRNEGIAIIVEIAKHRGKIRSALIRMHLRYNVPLIARLAIPKREVREWQENPYGELWRTYDRFMSAERYADMMREIGFTEINWKLLSLGGAFMLWGRKK